MLETIKLEGREFILWLMGEPAYGKRWFGSEYSENERKIKFWKGTGKIVYLLENKELAFLFETDSWNSREENWDRSLKESVIAFTNQDGCEIMPTITNMPTLIDVIAQGILEKLDTSDNEEFPFKKIHICTEKIEPLISQGIISSPTS